ncbi:hypothetical protein [Methylobacterium sp. E-066]|uniref:hypothetical protein n=1 Tax=Methylobacterium sp. E-066 TaxID=2836584 RepID=UPI001FBBDDF3|nr:hypothetical protein [Methylobacterium sp. E-066]MCJ2141916.1 hypothetical protein [Methylobacterium sp. E-066]
MNLVARTGEGTRRGLHKLTSEHRSPRGWGASLRELSSTAKAIVCAATEPVEKPQAIVGKHHSGPVHAKSRIAKHNPARLVLQRTPGSAPPRYITLMAMKSFSYLMIGVFASGLVMTLLGSVGLFAGS